MIDLETEIPAHEGGDELICYLKWLEDNDQQNIYYQQMSEEELEPLARIGNDGGLEESLFRFLSRQLYSLGLENDLADAVRYLASCLNERGYLTISLEELAQSNHISVPRLEQALGILRKLEPAGVGAENLSQCLELQLRRIGENGPALIIVQHYLELLAKRHYSSIAVKLDIPVEQVMSAEAIIRGLDPRPGAVFDRAEQIPYILPDIFVSEVDGQYLARSRNPERLPFQINEYYHNMLLRSQDLQVKEYLKEKLQQARNILQAVEQREDTILRCAQAIVETQTDFFRYGPQALLPINMADIADKLGIHRSTVSRAVHEKYIQCAHGVYPMGHFFSRSVSTKNTGTKIGGAAVKSLLKQMIDEEDKWQPLSDQKLAVLMDKAGCPISRRTVTKYREIMNIPDQNGRRKPL